MNTVEKIVEEVHKLPETDAREVLDFVGYLKAKRAQAKTVAADLSELGAAHERGKASEPEHAIDLTLFRQYRGLYDGKFNREELYDRADLR